MPPPNRVFYSYMEHRRPEEEEYDDVDFNKYMTIAKRLKHEADVETECERKVIKYLQAVLFFSLCGNFTEVKGDKTTAFNMYRETLDLVRFVWSPSRNVVANNKLK
jgi:AF4/FMR2 family protein 2